ncbi:MAG: hypothetical protein FJY29_02155 [Betaproteobacteria bacterium]|nr:hypothetical protein [Betaproteobacteria bacterium]
MLAIRCGVALEDSHPPPHHEWSVLRAKANSHLNADAMSAALQNKGELHVFTSTTALHFFNLLWRNRVKAHDTDAVKYSAMAVGVGAVTDSAVQTLQNLSATIEWSFPDLTEKSARLNGLQWTLEQLERIKLIPSMTLNLWTKTNSTSARILNEFRAARNWSQWKFQVHAIYTLTLHDASLPQEIADALRGDFPVCFGVKSAEILDATVALLMRHVGVTSSVDLPSRIRFCAWEKSALQRAQELFLQPRLQPFNEFEKLVSASESDS